MPCQFIDAAQESTAAQLWPSGLKSSLLVHLGYKGDHIYHSKSAPIHHIVLLFKASSVFVHSPCAQNQPAFIPDISVTFPQCTQPRHHWNMNPGLCFPGQTCLVVLPLFLCRPGALSCTSPLGHCITSSSHMARGGRREA